eukprot:SAG31_NODE_6866_length_1866_cov_1.333899_1_plen_140_part_00
MFCDHEQVINGWPHELDEPAESTGELHTKPVLQCMQKPGEILWLPKDWWHATANIDDCVGIGGHIHPVSDCYRLHLCVVFLSCESQIDQKSLKNRQHRVEILLDFCFCCRLSTKESRHISRSGTAIQSQLKAPSLEYLT